MKVMSDCQARMRETQGYRLVASCVALLLLLAAQIREAGAWDRQREQLIPILGITMGQEPAGAVAYLVLSFEDRKDLGGLAIHFITGSSRFSPMAQTSIEQAIRRSAQSLRRSTDSWTVMLSLPYERVTIYGDSLSAMVGLSVVALAEGKLIRSDRTITGTVTSDGQIGPVGSVGLKVSAAYEAHLRRVIVSDEHDPTDDEWQTPFLMHVYPVGSVAKAYTALTEEDASERNPLDPR
jgi:hypothetical protein